MEYALTGYFFRSREEVISFAESVPRIKTNRISDLCSKLNVYIVVGVLEVDNGELYNSSVQVGPDGLVGKYRKTHIPAIALDGLVEKGDKPPEGFHTTIGKICILICHDITFPESARILMLHAADVIVVPANFPRRPDIVAKHVINTRAVENFVHIVATDRVVAERKARFLGLSKIVNARGMTKASAGIRNEEIRVLNDNKIISKIHFVK